MIEKSDVQYFVHYIGYGKKWNEWIDEINVFKFNDKNVKDMRIEDKKEITLKKNNKKKVTTVKKT